MKKLFFEILLLSLFPFSFQAQLQLGSMLAGEGNGDFFGSSVALSADGQVLAVAAPSHDNVNGETAGQVKVFGWNGTDWVQKGDSFEGGSEGDVLGHSIALSADGQILAIASIGYDVAGVGNDVGKVDVYNWNGSSWVAMGTPIVGDMAGIYLGYSVSLSASGASLAIGVPFYSANFNALSGRVLTYVWDGNMWQLSGVLDGDNAGDRLGSVVAFSSDGFTLAAGAPFYTNTTGGKGVAYVYEWDGMNWALKGDAIYGVEGGYFGNSVALSGNGDVVAIGAPNYEMNGAQAGFVRTYIWDGSDWIQQGEDFLGQEGSRLETVALSENGMMLAVGAPRHHGYYGNETGVARVFAWDGNEWNQQGIDIEGMLAGDRCGNALALSDDGGVVAVGIYHDDVSGISQAGSVRVFEICPPTSSEISISACQSYTVPSGEVTYTESGVYVDEVLNSEGCGDSIITINLTILPLDNSVTNLDTALVANQTGATYQWVDCNNDYEVIPGAIGQAFIPQESGLYAVVINTPEGCTDTSACHAVVITSVNVQKEENGLIFYPNPAGEELHVELTKNYAVIEAEMKTMLGSTIASWQFYNCSSFVLDFSQPAGIYVVELVLDAQKKKVLKIMLR